MVPLLNQNIIGRYSNEKDYTKTISKDIEPERYIQPRRSGSYNWQQWLSV
jgi:hypothetical protein